MGGIPGGTRTHDFTDLQSATLAALSPVHNTTGYFLLKAFEAFALPLSESSKRIMLESNQRVINDFAERSLKLVVMVGLEPTIISV